MPESVTATRHASDNGVEVPRADIALQLASQGRKVAVVSGGDAGVFGMAAAVFEALEQGDAALRNLDIRIVPGMSAFLAASARIGAPMGHDFCVISLSDYLKPWDIIEKRLIAASEGDFALAIYNPASKTRRDQLIRALEILKQQRGGQTIVMIATSIGRAQEKVTITTLADINPDDVDMRTLLIIGASNTRVIKRDSGSDFIYTPRYYKESA